MPNDQIQPDMPLTAFAVPLEMLENVAGKLKCISNCICCLTAMYSKGTAAFSRTHAGCFGVYHIVMLRYHLPCLEVASSCLTPLHH